MTKVRTQLMLESNIYEALTQLSRKLNHRNISQTANELMNQYFSSLINMARKEKQTNRIDELNKKYNIPKQPTEVKA